MGTLADVNPTRLSKRSQGCPFTVRRLEKSGREIEKEFAKDNMLESKMTQDHQFFLWPTKRLENHLLCQEGSQK